MTIAQARTKRDDARATLASGTDPARKREQDKIAAEIAASNTFGIIAAEYIQRLTKGCAEATIAKNKWLVEDLASPSLNAQSLRSSPTRRFSCSSVSRVGRCERRTGFAARSAACSGSLVAELTVRHFCLFRQRCADRRSDARGGGIQFVCTPNDCIHMVRIEMRLLSIPFGFAAGVQHRTA